MKRKQDDNSNADIDAITLVKREMEPVEIPVPHEGGRSQLDCTLRAIRHLIDETVAVNESLSLDDAAQAMYVKRRMKMVRGKSVAQLERYINDLDALAHMTKSIAGTARIAHLAAMAGFDVASGATEEEGDDDTFI